MGIKQEQSTGTKAVKPSELLGGFAGNMVFELLNTRQLTPLEAFFAQKIAAATRKKVTELTAQLDQDFQQHTVEVPCEVVSTKINDDNN